MKKFHKGLIAFAIVAALGITYRAPVVDAAINAIKQLKIDLTNGRVPVAAGNLSGMTGDVTVASTGVATIGAGTVETAMLESGLSPSHVVLYADEITWSGSGATLSTAIMGTYSSSDLLSATITTVPTQAAYLGAAHIFNNNSAIFTLSAANTSNDAVIAYQVLRAAP